jgi:hypothetical protein
VKWCKLSPAGTRILTRCGTYLASRFSPRSQVARCGAAPSVGLFGLLPIAEGDVAVAPLRFRNEIVDQKCSDVVSGVGMPMLAEFQLWVLSTIVMLSVVIGGVKLPVRGRRRGG